MLRILHNTNWDVLKLWRVSFITVLAFVVPALVLVPWKGFNYSIEFTGGTQVEVTFQQAPDIAELRATLAGAGLADAEIYTFGSPEEIVVRAQEAEQVEELATGALSVSKRIEESLTAKYGAGAFTVGRTAGVGPRVGSELRQQAALATLIAFALTLVYIAWRFEWRFGVATILATVHDLVATLAFMLYMRIEISVFVVGAVLTVIGYSMNDTVVVFDRVRENLKLHRKDSLYAILNRSVNETMPRTVMTGSTTLATLLALLIFGGSVIRPFAWVLTFGIVVGTFSSVFIASPLLLWIERKWPRANEAAPTQSAARA